MPIVGGIARGQGQSAAGGPLGCRPRQSPRGRAGSTGLATSSSAPSPSSGSLPTAAPSLPLQPRAVGGGSPRLWRRPGPQRQPRQQGGGRRGRATRASELVFQPRAPRCPVLDAACDSRAAAESATFWEGKSVGTLGPAPGDGRPVYAHVYFTGSDVAAQNLERVVTLRHGSELFNPQSGSRSRAGRPGDWVAGGTGQSSAATVCGDVTDSNLPPKQPRRRLPSLPLSAPGRGRWPQRPPGLSFPRRRPRRWRWQVGRLRWLPSLWEQGWRDVSPPPPPRPPKAASHLEVEDPVALLEGDLEHLQRADVGGQAREALLAAAAHAY